MHGADGEFINAGQRPPHDVFSERAELAQRRRRFVGEIETVGAPVGCIVPPLDEARNGQFVDQAADRDRREVESFGQFVLLDALAALQAREDRPLRAGCAKFARWLSKLKTMRSCGAPGQTPGAVALASRKQAGRRRRAGSLRRQRIAPCLRDVICRDKAEVLARARFTPIRRR